MTHNLWKLTVWCQFDIGLISVLSRMSADLKTQRPSLAKEARLGHALVNHETNVLGRATRPPSLLCGSPPRRGIPIVMTLFRFKLNR